MDEPASLEQEQLALAERAFERGDYRTLRRMLVALTSATTPAVRERSGALTRELAPDRTHVLVLGGCSLILIAVFIHYVLP